VLGVGLPDLHPQAQPGALLLAALDQQSNAHNGRGAPTGGRTDELPGRASTESVLAPAEPENELTD
jgi:hypothetical protein